MLRSSRKIGDRVSALKYVLRPSLRCCNMPLCSSEISSRCRLDGRVCRNCPNSERYHHLPGRVRVAASTPWRTLGKILSSAGTFLRIMRILLRKLRIVQVPGRSLAPSPRIVATTAHRRARGSRQLQIHRNQLNAASESRGFHRSEEHTSELQSRLHLVCRL